MLDIAFFIGNGVNYLLTFSLILFLFVPLEIYIISIFYKKQKQPQNEHTCFLSCIITSYGSPEMCTLLIDSIIKSSTGKIEIIAILDNTDEALKYSHPDLKIIYPENPLHSKLKSIRLAYKFLNQTSEGIIVLDPDNLVHPEFFSQINDYFNHPYKVVQGRRKPKNTDTALAKAESLNEAYFNLTDRELPFQIGSSATLTGSGFCIGKKLFEEFLQEALNPDKGLILGEDKLLQNYLVQKGYTIAYAKNAVVYDEKVKFPAQFGRQRARWINAYFENIRMAGKTFLTGLASVDRNTIIFGLIALKPPVTINMVLLFILFSLNVYSGGSLAMIQGYALVIYVLLFVFFSYKLRMQSYLINIPSFLWSYLIALYRSVTRKKAFNKTITSSFISIDEAIKNDPLP